MALSRFAIESRKSLALKLISALAHDDALALFQRNRVAMVLLAILGVVIEYP